MSTTDNTTPTNNASTPNSQNLTENIFARCGEDHKAKLDLLADHYQSSEAAVVRELIEDAFHDRFDNIDPALAHRSSLSTSEILDLVNNDDIDYDSIHAELRRNTNTDNNVDETPRDYSVTLVPAELERSGPELDWDELRKAVQNPEDGGFWSSDLRIHPDRVGDETLRANHTVTSRVLAAMVRSIANDAMYHESKLTDLVEQYCLHLTDRFNAERGQKYIIETYENNVKRLLWTHPRPSRGTLFTAEQRYYQALPSLINDYELALNNYAPVIIKTDKCLKTDQVLPMLEMSPDEVDSIDEWKSTVGEAMELVVAARNIVYEADEDTLSDHVEEDEFEFTVRPEAEHELAHLVQTQKQFMKNYEDHIEAGRRKKILENNVSADAKEELIEE